MTVRRPWSSFRRARPATPRTVVGMWLRAGFLLETEKRNRLASTLNGGTDGWNYDEPAVVEAACEHGRGLTAAASCEAKDRGQSEHSQTPHRTHPRRPFGHVQTEQILPEVLRLCAGQVTRC